MVTDHFFSTLCISDLIHLQSIRCTYFPRRMKVTRSTGKCFLLAFAWWVFILYPIGNCWFGPGCISEAKQQPLLTSVAEKTQGSFSLCPANNTMGFRKGVKLLRLSLRSQRTRREVTEKAWKGGWMKLQLEPHKSNTVESQQSGEQSRRGEQCDISRPQDLLSGQRSGREPITHRAPIHSPAAHKEESLKRAETSLLLDTHLI